jgi:uncharacterized membrane protein YhaH (DUF805 family)
MSFFNKYFWQVVAHHYAGFSGRATRKEFWSYYLILVITNVILALFWFLSLFIGWVVVLATVSILAFIIDIILLIPTLAIMARRLHDIGWSGLWLLLFIVPIATFVLLTSIFLEPMPPDSMTSHAAGFLGAIVVTFL